MAKGEMHVFSGNLALDDFLHALAEGGPEPEKGEDGLMHLSGKEQDEAAIAVRNRLVDFMRAKHPGVMENPLRPCEECVAKVLILALEQALINMAQGNPKTENTHFRMALGVLNDIEERLRDFRTNLNVSHTEAILHSGAKPETPDLKTMFEELREASRKSED